jgi:hypothetical protein
MENITILKPGIPGSLMNPKFIDSSRNLNTSIAVATTIAEITVPLQFLGRGR